MATIRKIDRASGTVYIVQVKVKNKGKWITKSQTFTPEPKMSEKKLAAALEEFAENFENEVKTAASISSDVLKNLNITFKDYSLKWLERVKREQAPAYIDRAQRIVKVLNTHLGGHKIKSLSPKIIQDFYDDMDTWKIVNKKVVAKNPENFRNIVSKYGFKFNELRNLYGIQMGSYMNCYKGEKVGLEWAERFCSITKIPFNELFRKEFTETAYKPASIKKIKDYLRVILAAAKKEQIIDENYATADYITFPKQNSQPISVMDDEKAKVFFDYVINLKDIKIKTAMLIFLLAGFRRGEVAGLEWKYIDFKKNKITIFKTVQYITGFGIFEKEPKTKKSIRTITAPKILMDALQEYKQWQDSEKERLSDYLIEDSDKLFTKEDGTLINPDRFYRWEQKTLKDIGLGHYTLHSLRHTNITLQIASGVPLVTVSGRAGHAKTSTTTDIYSHFIQSSDEKAANIIDSFYGYTDESFLNCNATIIDNSIILTEDEYNELEKDAKEMGLTDYQKYLYIEKMKKRKNSTNG